MANVLPNPTGGFVQFGRAEGGAPTYGMTQVWIASTDASIICRGDPVVTSSAQGTNNSGNYITAAASGNSLVRGIFMGLEQYLPAVGRVVWSNAYTGAVTGSTGDVRAYIVDDPESRWLCFGSTTTTILSTMIGLNIGFTPNSTSGNTILGFSNTTLATTTTGSTATYPFRLLDFYSNYAPPGGFVNGTDNTTPANIAVVGPNNWDRATLTSRSA